jgi:linoleoyl-CoA desaturase
LHHTYTNIPGHDEDLDADESFDLQKMQNGILSIASTILLCIWFINFQLGITTDFRQMKTYLKENYPTVKQKPKTLWTTLIITKVIYVSFGSYYQ